MSKKNRNPWHKAPAAPVEAAPAAVALVEAQQPEPIDFSAISPAQLLANRANAQLSTGPRTAAGLAKSSKNAVKTALTGRTVLLPTDDVAEYASFIAGFQHDLAPVGAVECELVQDIADCHWRLRRIRALEFALYAHGHKQFENAFNDAPEEDRYNMILLQTDMTYQKQFRNYQIQEARIDRTRSKKLAELLRLQAERRANESEAETAEPVKNGLAGASTPVSKAEFAGSERAVAEPVKNGFDFSNCDFNALAAQLNAAENAELQANRLPDSCM